MLRYAWLKEEPVNASRRRFALAGAVTALELALVQYAPAICDEQPSPNSVVPRNASSTEKEHHT